MASPVMLYVDWGRPCGSIHMQADTWRCPLAELYPITRYSLFQAKL